MEKYDLSEKKELSLDELVEAYKKSITPTIGQIPYFDFPGFIRELGFNTGDNQ